MIEEIDYTHSPLGMLCLRKRRLTPDSEPIYEVKLNDEFLMSSQFTAGEVALAELPLRQHAAPASVLVAGLGLGYTAAAALADVRVRSLVVVEALEDVIRWHRERLVPLGALLTDDSRCELIRADFFHALTTGKLCSAHGPLDAILVDIDHSPSRLLHQHHAVLYREDGLAALASCLSDDGVFGLWSDDAAEPAFIELLSRMFGAVEAETVEVPRPGGGPAGTNTIYLARYPRRQREG